LRLVKGRLLIKSYHTIDTPANSAIRDIETNPKNRYRRHQQG
jgi:hypothetical protein